MHVEALAGKVAVVTGAARGLGLGLARAFAEADMRVVLSDIDEAGLEEAVASVREAGADAIGVVTDITDENAVNHLRDVTFERFGTAHVLCNNGGPASTGRLDEPIDVGAWRHAMDMLVYSVLYGINAFLPRFLEQGEGHIVNTSSRSGLVPVPVLGAYSPAKSAVLLLSEVLHANLAERGAPVGVTVLTPGFLRTERTTAALSDADETDRTDPALVEWLTDRMKTAVDPIDVGRLTVRAIEANALYVNTHRETLKWVQERIDAMVADADRIGTVR
jgi:NAD(P)-dependent dehydrogenase (short-subunit alcohol dehydrogenase family)